MVAAGLLVTGCGDSGGGASSASSPAAVPKLTAQDKAKLASNRKRVEAKVLGGDGTSSRALHGIIVMNCQVDANAGTHIVQLDAYDPDSGKTTGSETFTLPTEWSTPNSCENIDLSSGVPGDSSGGTGQNDTGYYRSMLSSDFSRLAVMSGDGSDDHVGYLDADGQLTDLTGNRSGFSSAPHDAAPSFNPITGDLLYATGRSVVAVGRSGHRRTVAALEGRSADAQPRDVNPMADGVLDPAGRRVLSAASQSCDACIGLMSEKPGSLSHPMENGGQPCRLAGDWFATNQVLCQSAMGGHSNITWLSLSKYGAGGVRLLPETDRNNLFPVASPDHQQFAFASIEPDGTQELYVSPLKIGGRPTEIADLRTVVPIVLGWE